MDFNSTEVLSYINNTIVPALKYTTPNFVKLFKKQEDFIRKFCIKNYILVSHSRQVGVSVALELLVIALCKNFPNINIAYIDSLPMSRTNFFIRVTNILNHINEDDNKYTDNALDRIEFDNNSKIYTFGGSSPAPHYKEINFSVVIFNNTAFIDDLSEYGPLLLNERDIVNKHNTPHGIIIASTPRYKRGYFYSCWNSNNDKLFKFKWSWKGIRNKEWYSAMSFALNNDRNAIKRELDLEFVDN